MPLLRRVLAVGDYSPLSFRDTVLLEAVRCNMGIIGMKSTTHGVLLKNGTVTIAEAMRMPELHTTGEIGMPPGK